MACIVLLVLVCTVVLFLKLYPMTWLPLVSNSMVESTNQCIYGFLCSRYKVVGDVKTADF